jgi:hypothetical protein
VFSTSIPERYAVKHSILAVVVSLFLISCAGTRELQPQKDVFVPVAKVERFSQETNVTSRLESDKLPVGVEARQAVWDKALTQSMRTLLNMYLQDGTLFVPSKGQEFFTLPLTRTDLSREPVRDPLTNDFRQAYLFTAVFIPDRSLSGMVANMKGKRTIGAMDDELFIEFFTSDYLENSAYFLLASPAPFDEGTHYQVYGSGRVKQITGTKGLGEILEVRKEVSVGDLVFLLQVNGEALKMETASQESEITPNADGPDEIVVEPVLEVIPVVDEPKELK